MTDTRQAAEQAADDSPQRICYQCRAMAPERFADAEIIRHQDPVTLQNIPHEEREACPVCGDSYDTRLRLLRPDIIADQARQRAEMVQRDREERQRLITDTMSANRARPVEGGHREYIPLHEQARVPPPPDGALAIKIRLRLAKNRANTSGKLAQGLPMRDMPQGIAAHTRLCRNSEYRARLARSHEGGQTP